MAAGLAPYTPYALSLIILLGSFVGSVQKGNFDIRGTIELGEVRLGERERLEQLVMALSLGSVDRARCAWVSVCGCAVPGRARTCLRNRRARASTDRNVEQCDAPRILPQPPRARGRPLSQEPHAPGDAEKLQRLRTGEVGVALVP